MRISYRTRRRIADWWGKIYLVLMIIWYIYVLYAAATFSNHVSQTWHDTRIICQHTVPASQIKDCG